MPDEQVQQTLAEVLAMVKSGKTRRMLAAGVIGDDPDSLAETGGPEVLAWGVVANVSRDLVRRVDDQRRPGTRHFVPGAKVWGLPRVVGDGGEHRYVVGTRRQSGGKKLIRVVMPADRLVNFRLRPVYSPAVCRTMTKDRDTKPEPLNDATGRTPPGLYERKQDAEEAVHWHEWVQTRRVHFTPESWDRMHRADQACEFCDGLDAYRAGASLDWHVRATHACGSCGATTSPARWTASSTHGSMTTERSSEPSSSDVQRRTSALQDPGGAAPDRARLGLLGWRQRLDPHGGGGNPPPFLSLKGVYLQRAANYTSSGFSTIPPAGSAEAPDAQYSPVSWTRHGGRY